MSAMLSHNGAGHFGSSIALGFFEPNLCEKNPPTHTKVGGHGGRQTTGGGPSGVQGGRGEVAQATGGHPGGEGNPWATQAALGAAGYVTVDPGTWDSGMGRTGRPDLGLHGDAPPSGSSGGGQLGPRGNQGDHPRRPWRSCVTRSRGWSSKKISDGYLKKQWRLIAKGELGYIPAKHIVSALPEEGEHPSSTHKKIMVDGWDREDEEEVRSHPTSRRQLERLHQTFSS